MYDRVSAICYLRGIFPPDQFSCRDYAGVTVHQLESAERDADGNVSYRFIDLILYLNLKQIVVRHKDAFLLTQ